MFIRNRRGFTLVELLVVIAIIGMLVGILLPAVQGARNAGRRTQNSNNLRNIGLAINTHAEAKGHLPPLRLIRPDSPTRLTENYPEAQYSVSWAFEVLPFMEQANVFDQYKATWDEFPSAAAHPVMQTPISIFQNPGRGERLALPDGTQATLIDYAANRGVAPFSFNGNQYQLNFEDHAESIGPFIHNSIVSTAHIKDGLSKTIAIADKWVPSDNEGLMLDQNGLVGASDFAIMRGPSARITRTGGSVNYNPNEPIFPSGNDDQSVQKFGGANGGSQLAICYLDGHVEWIQYDMDVNAYMSQCTINGNDGLFSQ